MNRLTANLIDEIDGLLPVGQEMASGGSLLIMVGLPGAGKSSLVRHLCQLVSCSVISTDQVRMYVRNQPTYSEEEIQYVYEICYSLIYRRLDRNHWVGFDGSNYLAERRQRLREIAQCHQIPFAIAHIQASSTITYERLAHRSNNYLKGEDLSDAGWSVYRRMVEKQEPIAGPHLSLDTSHTPLDILAAQLYEYWKQSAQFMS